MNEKTTRLRADFERREVVRPEDYEWVPSPMPGVDRMMLDRIGDEVARATSIVRYAPNSSFSAHQHSGGEEFLVLDGIFADEHGAYPIGTYARNPIGTAHTPKIGAEGATILVKLHQFEAEDQDQKTINLEDAVWQAGSIEGVRIIPLHEYGREKVVLEKWAPHIQGPSHEHHGGEELFVLEGTLYDEQGHYPKGTWLRNPDSSQHAPFTQEEGAIIWVKTGHLPPADFA